MKEYKHEYEWKLYGYDNTLTGGINEIKYPIKYNLESLTWFLIVLYV